MIRARNSKPHVRKSNALAAEPLPLTADDVLQVGDGSTIRRILCRRNRNILCVRMVIERINF